MNRPLTIFISHASDLLTDSKPHGDGLIADRFVRNLAARGHRIHIAINRSDLQQPYGDNVILHRIADDLPSGGALGRIRFGLRTRRLLRQLAAAEPIDVVHQLNPVVTGLGLALWGVNIPIVMGPYVPDWPLFVYNGKLQPPKLRDRLAQRLKSQVWQLQHRVASRIILSTPAAAGKIRSPSKWARKVVTIPYGVDTTVFTPKPWPARPTILFVGLVMHHKGIFVLLEALRQVLAKVPDCQLLIAGVGSEMELAKATAQASFQIPDQVTFLGHVQRNALPDLMGRSTVVSIPSFGEAFGLVAIEAMSCGRPIVGTDASGLAHLITEQGGRKVEVGNPDALATALIEILANPPLAKAMGEHNRSLAETRYAWPAVIRDLERVYHSAIEDAAASRKETS